MISLADINQVLTKKRNLDSKLVLLKEYLNQNDLDFCFFSLSKTFSKRFEICINSKEEKYESNDD